VAVYRLDLPYQRPPLRSNDSHADPRARGRIVKQVRNDVMLLAKSAGMKPGSHMVIQLHYAPGHNRKMDSHNLHPTVKACVDALARGKRKDWVGLEIVPDDDDRYVTVLTPVIDRPPEPGPRCWLIVQVHHDTTGSAA
jgi:crossover junction endodeoxyribonuclease RusA